MLEILVPCVITRPKCTGGAPLVLLVLLLGTGDGEGVSLTCETCVVSEISEDLEDCWLVCGLASEVSVNTSVDV